MKNLTDYSISELLEAISKKNDEEKKRLRGVREFKNEFITKNVDLLLNLCPDHRNGFSCNDEKNRTS